MVCVRQKSEHFINSMKKTPMGEAVARAKKLRKIYHRLELQHHGSEWTVEEDALAFLTDAGLVGRLTMAHESRWPVEEGKGQDLEHKLGECIWWLMVLAGRMGIDAERALETFLARTEQQLKDSHAPRSSQRTARRVVASRVSLRLPRQR